MVDKADLQTESPWADLVIAMLSVNSYPIERTFMIFDELKANGLLDVRNLAYLKHAQIFTRLVESGYKRGDLIVGLLTERLLSLGVLAEKHEVNEKVLASGTEEEIAELLSKVKGVGPVVRKNFFMLRGRS